jgi:hypothetical protein
MNVEKEVHDTSIVTIHRHRQTVFAARCSCGWESDARSTDRAAADDATNHLVAVFR